MESKVSVQDEFLALADTANEIKNKVQTRFAEAPKELGQLLQSIWSLVVILSELHNHTGEPALTNAQKTVIQKIQADCQHVLVDTESAVGEHPLQSFDTEQDDAFNSIHEIETVARNINEYEIDGFRRRICSIISALDAAITEPNRVVLNWLVPNEYNAGIQAEYFSKRATGTYQWFLDSPDYQTWSSTQGKIFFCHGGLGVGKSVLASTVIASLQESYISTNGAAVCYFYFSDQVPGKKTFDHVMLAMLWQLVRYMSAIPMPIMDMIKRHQTVGGRPSSDEVREAFCTVASTFSRLSIVIDAVNEYGSSADCHEDILSALLSLQAEVGANLFLTSRAIPHIAEPFLGHRWTIFRASDEDIAQFVRECIYRLPNHVRSKSSLHGKIVHEVVRAANGVFIHAKSRLDVLMSMRIPKKDKVIGRYIGQALSFSLGNMDIFYEEAWHRICDQNHDQKELAIRVLSWVTYARRPLTRTELQHALSIQLDELEPLREKITTIENMVSSCCGLLAIHQESNLVQLIHWTAKDYFSTLAAREQTRIPAPETMLTNACITYLSFNVFESGKCGSDAEFEARLASYPFYNYASCNWGHHAIFSDDLDRVRLFLDDGAKVEASCQALFSVKQNEDDHGYSQKTPECPWSIQLSEVFGLAQYSKSPERSWQDEVLDRAISWDDPWRDVDFDIANITSDGYTALSSSAKKNRETIVQWFLENGAKAECQYNNPDTPLAYAAKHGQVKIVRLLLDRNLVVDPKDIDGNVALLHAAARKHESVVELLLKHGKSLKKRRKGSLEMAAFQGREALVRFLLETLARTQLPDNIRYFVILYAIERKHHDIVQLLSKPDYWKTYMLEVLQSLVQEDRSKDILSLLQLDPVILPSADVYRWAVTDQQPDVILSLLQRGPRERFGEVSWEKTLLVAIDNGNIVLTQMILNSSPQIIHWRDDRGRTVLFYACDFGKGDIVKALLDEHKADVNAQCKLGRTPLISAAYNEMNDVVAILLSHEGIEVDKTDKLGRDVLSIASQTGKVSLVKRLLKCSQVDPDSADSLRRTPLSWAAGEGHSGIVDRLINTHLIDIDYADTNGRTPLFWACSQGHEEAASRLLLAGCDAKLWDKGGQTALHVAAQAGSDSICELLLEKVDPDVFDRNHNTALMLALENDRHKVVRLLQKTADATLCFLAKQGRHRELQLLFEKGFSVNKVDDQGRSLLILAVIHEKRAVLRLLIENEAFLSADADGLSPLEHAMRIKDCESIHELLRAGSETSTISASQWYSAFSKEESHFVITQESGGQKAISFHPLNKPPLWPEPSHPISRRSLLVTRNVFVQPRSTLNSSGLEFSNSGHTRANAHKTYRVDAWYSPVKETECLSRNKWSYSIEWTLQKTSKSGNNTWSSVEHRTTLPIGSVPYNGLNFFERLLRQIAIDWKKTCSQANEKLTVLRQRVFKARGADLELIDDLLMSAHGLSYLRQSSNKHIESAETFRKQYCALFHKDTLQHCARIIRDFAQTVGQQLDALDQTSQNLIQIEFNLVSIREARESTSMSASMKRLSWITFIFLPAMFVSSIFGMNVDILANNPDWRWYMLFVSVCLLIIFLGWLIFKYCNAEHWIYLKIGRPVEKCTERFRREQQIYSHEYPRSSQNMSMMGVDGRNR